MRLHVMAGILLYSLNLFSNENSLTQQRPKIQNSFARRPSVQLYQRQTPSDFMKVVVDLEESDNDSNGTRSVATSPSVSPKPQLLPECVDEVLSRKESFDSMHGANRLPLLPSTGSMNELGSPLKTPKASDFNKSLTEHGTTPPTDHGTTPPGRKKGLTRDQMFAVLARMKAKTPEDKIHPTTPIK